MSFTGDTSHGIREAWAQGARDAGFKGSGLCQGNPLQRWPRQQWPKDRRRGHEAGHGQCSIQHLTGEVEGKLCGGKQGQAESIYTPMKNKNVIAQWKPKGESGNWEKSSGIRANKDRVGKGVGNIKSCNIYQNSEEITWLPREDKKKVTIKEQEST